jgi:hypothetical protein
MEVRINGVKYVPVPDLPTDSTLLAALELRINSDIGEVTIREYLRTLLSELWREEESFNGKRPFGNSGWQYDVYTSQPTPTCSRSSWLCATGLCRVKAKCNIAYDMLHI